MEWVLVLCSSSHIERKYYQQSSGSIIITFDHTESNPLTSQLGTVYHPARIRHLLVFIGGHCIIFNNGYPLQREQFALNFHELPPGGICFEVYWRTLSYTQHILI